jgi:hypothetical protein
MASSPNTYMHTNKQTNKNKKGASDSGKNPCVHHTASIKLAPLQNKIKIKYLYIYIKLFIFIYFYLFFIFYFYFFNGD